MIPGSFPKLIRSAPFHDDECEDDDNDDEDDNDNDDDGVIRREFPIKRKKSDILRYLYGGKRR